MIKGSSCSPLRPSAKRRSCSAAERPPMRISRSACRSRPARRELAATFLKDTLIKEGIIDRIRDDAVQTYFEGVGSITVAGPFKVQGPGETATRDKIFICRPSGTADEKACAEKILSNLAHRAYRRPVSADDMPQLLALYKAGAAGAAASSRACRLALQKILVSPDFLFRAEIDPPGAAPGSVYKVSDIELASRLSFFLWSSIPDDELLSRCRERAPHRPGGPAGAGQAHAGRSALAGAGEELLRPVAVPAQHRKDRAGSRRPSRMFDENLRQALAKETELLIESQVREDHSVADLLEHGLHLPQSAPGRALRDQGHLRQRVPPRQARRSEPLRPARTGQHPCGDLLSQPDGADDPRKVGVGAAPGHAAAAAAAQCSMR